MTSKISTNIVADLAIETLLKAITTHKPSVGLILHSDQCFQYTSKAFNDFCCSNKSKQFIIKDGCPHDNVLGHHFMGNLKMNI